MSFQHTWCLEWSTSPIKRLPHLIGLFPPYENFITSPNLFAPPSHINITNMTGHHT